jgi:hypothetical protein
MSASRNVTVQGGQGPVIGEHNRIYQFFQAQQNRSLASKATSFIALIQEKTANFVGRQFVFDALDGFLRDSTSGYFVITGEPGIGKTALMAQIVKARGYPHHFNVSQDNIRSPAQFLESACAQMIARYNLPYKQLPEDAGRDSSFLSKLLVEAAADEKRRPVVLLVDALDEAERETLGVRANILFLPRALPQGAYLVVTTRPLDDLQLQVERRQDLLLDPDSSGNKGDISAYIENYLSQDARLQERLSSWRTSPAQFVSKMAQKSQGNFIYLRFVLPDISAGKFVRGMIEELPQGLQEYYKAHWRQMKAAVGTEFETYYAPVVCVLAVAREPVSVELVGRWTGLPLPKIQAAVRQWREFLKEENSHGEPRYRVYHTSFKDFLEKQVSLEQYDVLVYRSYLDKLDLE